MNLNDILKRRDDLVDQIVEKMKEKKRCHLYAYAGFGKTNIVQRLVRELKLKSVLYVKPASDKEANKSRFVDYPQIELISYASLHKAAKTSYDLVIADESDNLASFRVRGGSKRAKMLFKIAAKSPRFIGLSATLYRENPLSLYGVQTFVDFGEALGRYFSDFGNKYFTAYQRENFTLYKEKPDTLSRIAADMSKDVITVQYSEIFGDLPEYDLKYLKVPLDAEIMQALRSLENESCLGTRTVSAGITRISLMLQVASGFYMEEDLSEKRVQTSDRDCVTLSDNRFEACWAKIHELVKQGKKVVVFANFLYEQNRLYEGLRGIKASIFGKTVKKEQGLKDFITGDTQVLISHAETLGVGVDGLQKVCSDMIFFNVGISLRQFYQATARISTPRQLLGGGKLTLEDYAKGTVPTVWVLTSDALIEKEVAKALDKKSLEVESFKTLTAGEEA